MSTNTGTPRKTTMLARVLNQLHHWRLLFQLSAAGRGKTLALKDGTLVALRDSPQSGGRVWVDANGKHHESSTVEAILDRGDFGY